MAKGLVYADNHYGQYSSIVRGRTEKSSIRLDNQIKSFNWAEQLAEELKCDFVIGLGDTFDRPDLNAEELTMLQEVKWADIPHYFLVGNHEMGLNDLSYSSAHLLKMVPKAKVIDKPYYESGFGYRFIFLPYILETNRKSLKEHIYESIGDSWETQEVKKTIIFSHNDIKGIRYGQWESKVGFDIEEICDNCDLYLNGHLHNQTQINEKILNLGNLTGQNFSEDAEKYSHCVGIIDTDTLQIDLINNPYALNFYKFEILNKEDFNNLQKCKENTVLSIKTYQSLVPELKQELSRINPICYRIITIPELKVNNEEVKTFTKLDHIQQFKDYINNQLGYDDIINEELSKL